MKIKLELDNHKYEGNVEEVNKPVSYYLIQARNESEVFVVMERVKHWIQNPQTAIILEYDLSTRKIMSLDEVNYFVTGDTFNMTTESTERARDIYYPEPEKPYPFKGLRALLTLKPKPTKQQIIDLGFNAMMPYSGSVDWQGDYISIPRNRLGKVILRYTGDELDCHKLSPQDELDEYRRMKDETPDIPVGFNLNCSVGCGLPEEGKTIGQYKTIEEYKTAWIEAVNQVDYVLLDIYPYRTRWDNAIEAMERFYNDWTSRITVPIIPVIQAHWVTNDLIKPDPLEQIKFWFSKGISGYVVYCWADRNKGVRDMQQEWKKANDYAKNNL